MKRLRKPIFPEKATTSLTPIASEIPKPLTIKPERLYNVADYDIDNIKIGDIIPVKVISYASFEEIFICEIGDRTAIITTPNFCYPEIKRMKQDELNDFLYSPIQPTFMRSVGKQVVGKVINILSDRTIILDRKSVMKETVEILSKKIDTNVTACIETITSYGAFIDIGNGVNSLLHITKMSICRYNNISDLLDIGDTTQVKLLNYDLTDCQFKISRKDAYEKTNPTVGSIVTVKCCSIINSDGWFVEYNPSTSGIMDIPYTDELSPGDVVCCYVKNITSRGFQAKFLWYAPK